MAKVKINVFCESFWICGHYGRAVSDNGLDDAKKDNFKRCLKCEAFQIKVKE